MALLTSYSAPAFPNNMFIVTHRKFFYILSGLITGVALFAMFFYGFNYGIDFKGGSIIEVAYTAARPDIEMVKQGVAAAHIEGASIRETGDKGLIVRTSHLEETARQNLLTALSLNNTVQMEQKRFDSVGPTLGAELQGKALFSILLVMLVIVLFIAFVFRKVSEPVASWKYGIIAIVALLHDVIVPAGAFAVLGHYMGAEIDSLFVTALLVILGFSIHDTIVVFDRVRENLRKNTEYRRKEEFETVVGKSVAQTFARSINTSLTTLLTLFVLYIVGSDATRWFSLALLIGITSGTYSSVFLASPLLVTVEKWQRAKLAKAGK